MQLRSVMISGKAQQQKIARSFSVTAEYSSISNGLRKKLASWYLLLPNIGKTVLRVSWVILEATVYIVHGKQTMEGRKVCSQQCSKSKWQCI